MPLKTPMYEAQNAERYLRQSKIKAIQNSQNCRLLCYVAGCAAPITRDDIIGIAELLHNVAGSEPPNVDLLLHTGGGEIDAAEKIVSMLRASTGKEGRFRVVVPDFAKSAGTLIALAADSIVMSDSSELGPIDPQFCKGDGDGNVQWHSVLNYLGAYDRLYFHLNEHPDDTSARIMFSKLDPTMVEQLLLVKKRALRLAEEHLNHWMFHKRVGNYTKIAADLMDTTRWLSHGQMIGWEDAKEMGLEVQYLASASEIWREYWALYCLQRFAIKDDQKLFESDCVSLPM